MTSTVRLSAVMGWFGASACDRAGIFSYAARNNVCDTSPFDLKLWSKVHLRTSNAECAQILSICISRHGHEHLVVMFKSFWAALLAHSCVIVVCAPTSI